MMRNLSIVHNLEGADGVIEQGPGGTPSGILPKLIDINFDFAVIHEHALGWDEESLFSNPGFPYGIAGGTSITLAAEQQEAEDRAQAASRAAKEQRENETLEEAPEAQEANARARLANVFRSVGGAREPPPAHLWNRDSLKNKSLGKLLLLAHPSKQPTKRKSQQPQI